MSEIDNNKLRGEEGLQGGGKDGGCGGDAKCGGDREVKKNETPDVMGRGEGCCEEKALEKTDASCEMGRCGAEEKMDKNETAGVGCCGRQEAVEKSCGGEDDGCCDKKEIDTADTACDTGCCRPMEEAETQAGAASDCRGDRAGCNDAVSSGGTVNNKVEDQGCEKACCGAKEQAKAKDRAEGGGCDAEAGPENASCCDEKLNNASEPGCKSDCCRGSCCETSTSVTTKASKCWDPCCNEVAEDAPSNTASARLDQLQSAMQRFEALLRLGRCLCRRMIEEFDFCCCCEEGSPCNAHKQAKEPVTKSSAKSGGEDDCCVTTKTGCIETSCAMDDDCKAIPIVKIVSVKDKSGDVDIEVSATKDHVALSVTGMTCTGCSKKMLNVLGDIPGISNPHVTFVSGMAAFDFDPAHGSVEEILPLIEKRTGFKLGRITADLQTLDVLLSKEAAGAYEREDYLGLESFEKVKGKNKYRITYDPRVAGARSLMPPGGELAPPEPDAAHSEGRKRLRSMALATFVSAVFTIPVVVLSWSENPVPERTRQIISLVLATFVQAVAIPEFYFGALKSLVFSKVVEMDMLIVISITAAYGYSVVAFALAEAGVELGEEAFFETSSLLITLVLLGRLMAAAARVRAVSAVSMSSLQRESALLLDTDGRRTEEIDARLLQFGDLIRVPAHTSIVTDGIVVAGSGAVDESMYTGESEPVTKLEGDAVIAGTINGGTILDVKIMRLPNSNSISDIKNLVQDALGAKPRVQDLADKVASWFIPVVCTISLITFGIWVAVALTVRDETGGGAVGTAITYAIAVLAIACPCALGLAVPMVLVVAGGVAARSGVAIKSVDALERGYKTTDVVFDKTGTLTLASLAVVHEYSQPSSDISKDLVVAVAKALVTDNNHPVSIAISKHLQDHLLPAAKVEGVQSLPGSGIQCTWQGRQVQAGNPRWLRVSNDPAVINILDKGLTAFCVSVDGTLVLVYGLQSTLRPEAHSVIASLSARRLRCHILSGDNQKAVHTMATAVGIDPLLVRAQCTPAQKKEYVEALQRENRIVLFCGDGTNDAVAVAQANVGMQIAASSPSASSTSGTGTTASAVTQSVCDVTLLGTHHPLTGIEAFLNISKRSFRRIVFNFVWSAVYNVLAILLASGALVKVRIAPAYAGLGEVVMHFIHISTSLHPYKAALVSSPMVTAHAIAKSFGGLCTAGINAAGIYSHKGCFAKFKTPYKPRMEKADLYGDIAFKGVFWVLWKVIKNEGNAEREAESAANDLLTKNVDELANNKIMDILEPRRIELEKEYKAEMKNLRKRGNRSSKTRATV
ncbi:hypothetical protein CBER1_09852 [Cercospora berteroae]|uniref:HMA domain-containing protein n=1 Tax=Cercospora berteroae TaxID=357750 RepID=A0A2S6CE01_9PEZI|nr:hypothetical protein CBER1_09852 [Cercospora berteroae]